MKHPGNIQKAAGATHHKKRIGRGAGSGLGGTSTRGANGQKSRAGAHIRIGFEGGQMPMNRRLPKFGFSNRFRVEYQEVNVGRLQSLVDNGSLNPADTVDAVLLYNLAVIRKSDKPFKVLGNGEIKVALNIVANGATKSAKEKIEAAGGKIEITGLTAKGILDEEIMQFINEQLKEENEEDGGE